MLECYPLTPYRGEIAQVRAWLESNIDCGSLFVAGHDRTL